MQRYYINSEQVNNKIITIKGNDVHHIKDVMRMNIGDEVICVLGDGHIYHATISSITKEVILNIISEEYENNELNGNVTIAQGLVRREKTEEVLRRLVELGCSKYIRCEMIRSIVKKNDDKLDRLNTIVKEASEQSHRSKLMEVTNTLSFKELLSLKDSYDFCFYADCNEKSSDIYSLDNNFKGKNILILVGPEGGFDPSEVKLLNDNGFKALTFGNRILRTETAPLYAMSVFSYFLGENNED